MENVNTNNEEVRLAEKYALPIIDAAKVFGIGQHMIRSLTQIPNNNYTLKIGTKTLIKREKFQEYLDKRNVL